VGVLAVCAVTTSTSSCARAPRSPAIELEVEHVAAATAGEAKAPVVEGGVTVDLGAIAAEIGRACTPAAAAEDAQTTIGALEAGCHQVSCLEGATAIAFHQAASHLADPAPLATARRDLDHLIEDTCWLTEESRWVDLDEGTRDDGSLRSFAWLACMKAARVEETLLFRAFAAADTRSFAQRVEAAGTAGETSFAELRGISAKAEALVHRPVVAFSLEYPRPLDMDARRSYVSRAAAIRSTSRSLARATCALFSGLADELGGETGCVDKAAAYYVALGDYSERAGD
jgi:hypothetical protein